MNKNKVIESFKSNYNYQCKFGDTPSWLSPSEANTIHKEEAIKETALEHELTTIGVKRIINKENL